MFSISDVFSATAIIVSGLALLQASQTQQENKRLQRENLDLQKRMLWIEEARERDRLIEGKTAKLIARIEKNASSGKSPDFVIENKGQSEARDIKIVINGSPADSYGGITYQPMSVVPSGGCFPFSIHNTRDLPDQFHVSMTWTDDSREPGLFQATLPI